MGTTDSSPFNNSANTSADNGIALGNAGNVYAARYNFAPLDLNRTGSNGDIIALRKSGAIVGSIGTVASNIYLGTGDTGIYFNASEDKIYPINTSTIAGRDAAIDLGKSDTRFKDLHLSGIAYTNGVTTTDNLIIGTEDNNSAVLEIKGGATGSSEGGEIRLDLAADHDGTYDFYRIDVYQDDFRIGRAGTTDITIDSSGKVGIGATSPETPLHVSTAKSSVTDSVLTLQDTTETFGKMIEFVGEGSTDCRGIIGFQEPQGNAPELYITNGGTESAGSGVGLAFWQYISTARISPCDSLGDYRDNAIDLGWSSARFDDIYATNGTIQTSDRNDKQDIQALTDAETRVATACKGLLRRFRWQDAVTEKGDEARYHFGIISQDLQDAFTAEGLDAGDYGMFISETWEDSNGVEQTRLGVRYSELLAFIIAAI